MDKTNEVQKGKGVQSTTWVLLFAMLVLGAMGAHRYYFPEPVTIADEVVAVAENQTNIVYKPVFDEPYPGTIDTESIVIFYPGLYMVKVISEGENIPKNMQSRSAFVRADRLERFTKEELKNMVVTTEIGLFKVDDDPVMTLRRVVFPTQKLEGFPYTTPEPEE